jgi:hypothetical protein
VTRCEPVDAADWRQSVGAEGEEEGRVSVRTNRQFRHQFSVALLTVPAMFMMLAFVEVRAGVEVARPMLVFHVVACIACAIVGAALSIQFVEKSVVVEMPTVKELAQHQTGIQGEAPGPSSADIEGEVPAPASTSIRTNPGWTWRPKGG